MLTDGWVCSAVTSWLGLICMGCEGCGMGSESSGVKSFHSKAHTTELVDVTG